MPRNSSEGKIYIAVDHDGNVLSMVCARSKELAVAFWHGKDIIPHHTDVIDPETALEHHPTGVLPLAQIEWKGGTILDSKKTATIKR